MGLVRLDHIVFDAGTQVRAAINEQVVTDYAERMAEAVVFPPVVLFHDGNAYYLADGFHRVMAAQRNQFCEIDADVRAGTKTDALWFALGANKANGQRLSMADKKHAVVMALQMFPDKSQTQIAEQVGCHLTYVTRIRGEVSGSQALPSKVVGKDGKSYPATRETSPVIEQRRDERRETIAAMVKSGKQSREIVAELKVRPETVADVRRELGVGSDNTKASVAKRRDDIRDMAARGFTTRQIAGAVGLSESRVAEVAKREQIVIHADRVVGKTHKHDPNRIIERMALDATGLCADVDLIEFAAVDAARIPEWLQAFKDAREQLGGFIRRLMKEQQRNGEAA